MSGLKTITVPTKPINKAITRLTFILSFKNITAKIVVKIGTVKFKAVNCDSVVKVNP